MIRAARLKDRVALQRRVQTTNAYNETVWTWADVLADEPARVHALTGRETFAAQQLQASHTHEIHIRYRPGVNANATMRFVQQLPDESPAAVYYAIEKIRIDDKRTWLTAECVVRDADGWRTDGG